jgi:hypothetical protein
VSEQNDGGGKLAKGDYPALYLAADQASTEAQRKYTRLMRSTLVLLVVGACLAVASPAFDYAKPAFALASAVCLAVSLALTTYLKTQKVEQLWYGGRAVAESAKSMTWRYMTGTDPYFAGLSPAEADRKFVSDLESIIKERRQLAFGFGGEFAKRPQISERMRAIRATSLEERTNVYLAERIADQRRWYGDQALLNRSARNRYLNFIIAGQSLAVIAAIALVRWPDAKVKLTGLFTSLASALIAWLQVRQHKELAQSYSIAEVELGFIQERAPYITSDRELADFVRDAENAISREHTLWIARRDRT